MSEGITAHALFAPTLRELAQAALTASERVVESAQVRKRRAAGAPAPAAAVDPTEAVHDFRVALRRLRTLLRPARVVYGKKRTRPVEDELRRFGDATGALRDEEVLRETLAALRLPPRARQALDAWMIRRARQERGRRAAVVRLMIAARGGAPGRAQRAEAETEPRAPSSGEAETTAQPPAGSLEHGVALLEELVGRPKRPGEAVTLGLAAVAGAQAEVRALAEGEPHGAEAMHALRIRWKRLRYTAELFSPLLGGEVPRLAKGAAKMQKRLGQLHDLDGALERLRRARGLAPHARTAGLQALRAERTRTLAQARRELADELDRWSDERAT